MKTSLQYDADMILSPHIVQLVNECLYKSKAWVPYPERTGYDC